MGGSDASDEARLSFLREVGAADIRHVGASLLEHLVATRDLLAAWGAPAAVCDAALFHAVYGTQELDARLPRPPVDPGERERVRARIGPEAERLVWLFARLDRAGFVDWLARGADGAPPMRPGREPEALSEAEVRGMANLIVANALEQARRRGRRHARRTRELIRLRAHLLPAAVVALRRERSLPRRLWRRWRAPHGARASG